MVVGHCTPEVCEQRSSDRRSPEPKLTRGRTRGGIRPDRARARCQSMKMPRPSASRHTFEAGESHDPVPLSDGDRGSHAKAGFSDLLCVDRVECEPHAVVGAGIYDQPIRVVIFPRRALQGLPSRTSPLRFRSAACGSAGPRRIRRISNQVLLCRRPGPGLSSCDTDEFLSAASVADGVRDTRDRDIQCGRDRAGQS